MMRHGLSTKKLTDFIGIFGLLGRFGIGFNFSAAFAIASGCAK
jgi:hypothetical protein